MKVIIFNFAIISIISTFNINSQTVEPSTGVDQNNLQIELESIYSIQKEAHQKIKSWSTPSILFRYGFINNVELQLNIPVIKEQLYENKHLIHSLHKFDDIQVGFSVNLLKQHKFMPEAALMVRAIITTNNKLNSLGKIISLNLSNNLSKSLSLNYNIGYILETTKHSSSYFIANISYELNDKVHLFVEDFIDFSETVLLSNNLTTGIGYNINENFCLDISISNGINHDMFYVGGILSWNINLTKS